MRWHPIPKDDAWKQAHLVMVKGLGKRLWLRCDICGHTVMAELEAFAASHGLVMLTPLLSISRALRCTQCGERKAWCRPDPHTAAPRERVFLLEAFLDNPRLRVEVRNRVFMLTAFLGCR
jgi:hypothetical protein